MLIEYLIFAGMLLLYAGTGYALGAQTLLTAVLLGLGNAGIVANILAVFGPALVKPALFGLALLGSAGLYLARGQIATALKDASALTVARLRDALLLVVVVWMMRFFAPVYYVFEPHDILYFSPALEMLQADYFGSLRLFTYYPETMASFHHFSSGILAALAAPLKTPTLVDMAAVRHFLLTVCVFLFLRTLVRRRFVPVLLICLAVFTIYGEEINYSMTISSYFYVLLLFGIVATLMRRQESPQVFVLLLFVLCCAKGPIFYSAFLAALFAVAIFWRQVSKPLVIVYLCLVVAVVFSWTVPPPPYEGQDLGLTIYRGLPGAAAQEAMNGVTGWTLSDPVVRQIVAWFGETSLLTALLLLVLNTTKYYLVSFIGLHQLGRRFFSADNARPAMDQAKMGMVLAAYAVVSLAGFLWVRNGITAMHQAHGPLLAAALSAAVLSVWAAERRSLFAPLLVCASLLVLYMPRSLDLSLPNYHVRQGRQSLLEQDIFTWKIGDPLPVRAADGWYRPAPGEPMVKSELLAGLTGQRLRKTDALSVPEGVIRHWRTGD